MGEGLLSEGLRMKGRGVSLDISSGLALVWTDGKMVRLEESVTHLLERFLFPRHLCVLLQMLCIGSFQIPYTFNTIFQSFPLDQ